jgi:hypothetical protein
MQVKLFIYIAAILIFIGISVSGDLISTETFQLIPTTDINKPIISSTATTKSIIIDGKQISESDYNAAKIYNYAINGNCHEIDLKQENGQTILTVQFTSNKCKPLLIANRLFPKNIQEIARSVK